jgi:hypothetical protein
MAALDMVMGSQMEVKNAQSLDRPALSTTPRLTAFGLHSPAHWSPDTKIPMIAVTSAAASLTT